MEDKLFFVIAAKNPKVRSLILLMVRTSGLQRNNLRIRKEIL
jgi:hypothetical protein